MINVSNAFRQELVNDRRNYQMTVYITLLDNTQLILTNENIMMNGFSMDDAVSVDNSFQALGGCVINSATLIINNRDDSFSTYDFEGAGVVVYVQLLNERIKKGTFVVNRPTYNGFSITLQLLDNMEKFDRQYTSSLVYPATLDNIVRNACTACGVTLATLNFPHKDFVITTKPNMESCTYRDVIKWCATIAGCFARCNTDGELELKWFRTADIENINGGEFDNSTPYSTGDAVDGGTMSPWNTGDVVDAGQFNSESTLHYLYSLYSQNIAVEDTVITGVQAVVKNSADSATATTTYAVGQTGYVISVEDNPLITADNVQSILAWLGTQLIGLRFRQLTITHTNDPTIEAGDCAIVFDRKGNEYPILITRTAFSVTNKQTTVCASETVSKNSSVRYSEATRNYVEARALIKETRTNMGQVQEDLQGQIDAAGGLYKTEVVENNATKIYYHNKPELADSDIIMLFSDLGFTISADGGTTWYGLTVDGVLIASILNTIGINADWINTGELVISKTVGGTTQEMLYANVDTGVVRIVADSFSLSTGDTIESIAEAYANTKSKTFTSQPVPPYNVGDLWAQGSTGDLLRCTTAKAEGELYSSSDWVVASKYTDDTVANSVKQHFWFDSDGAHIATTADDGDASYNAIWNSSTGLTFRKDTNKIADFALDGITFYDGEGNDVANILASFGIGGAQIGKFGTNNFKVFQTGIFGSNEDGVDVFLLDTNGGIASVDTAITNMDSEKHILNDTTPVTVTTELTPNILANSNLYYTCEYGYDYLPDPNQPDIIQTEKHRITNVLLQGVSRDRREHYPVSYYNIPIKFISSYDGNNHITSEWIVDHNSGLTEPANVIDYYIIPLSVRYSATTLAPALTVGTKADEEIPGGFSFRFGEGNSARGYGSSATGVNNTTSGRAAVTEGEENTASGDYSRAGGYQSVASGNNSFAHGEGVKAVNDNQASVGRFNTADTNVLFAIGNGVDDTDRSDAFWVGDTGDIGFDGALYTGQPSGATKLKLFTTGDASQDNISVSANSSSSTITIDLSKTGYKPMALRGIRVLNATTNGSSAATCVVYTYRIEGDDFICAVRNHGSTNAKIKIVVYALYVAETAL